MINVLLKKILPIMLILGSVQISIAITICLLGNMNLTTYMTELSVYDVRTITIGTYTQDFYIFNLKNYLTSIKASITNLQVGMFIPEQTPKTIPAIDWTDILSIGRGITNSLFYVINWITYILNILISPLKLILTGVMLMEAILGMDLTNISVIQAINQIYYLAIPQIEYLH